MAIQCPLCGRGHGEYCLKAGRLLRPDEGLEGATWDTDFGEIPIEEGFKDIKTPLT